MSDCVLEKLLDCLTAWMMMFSSCVLDRMEGLVFLEVKVVAVYVDVDRRGIPFAVRRGRQLQHLAVASAVEKFV